MVQLALFSKKRAVGWEDILSNVCTLSKFPPYDRGKTFVGDKVVSSIPSNLGKDAHSSLSFIIPGQPENDCFYFVDGIIFFQIFEF